MSGWNGSGTFTRTYNWQQDQANGIKITAVRHDQNDTDFVNGINACLTKDGQNQATANLPMGGFKHTNVADATARNQYATLGQVQDNAGQYYTTTGSSNAYILTPSPAITSYTAGQIFSIKASFANTGAATINISGLGAKSLTKQGTTALASGDIISGAIYLIQYDGTQFQIINSNIPLTLTGNFTFTGNNTYSGNSTFTGIFNISGTSPYLQFNDTDGGTDAKYSEITNTSSGLTVRFLNDAYSLANVPLTISRSGYTCNGVTWTLNSGTFNLNTGFVQTYTTVQNNDMYFNATTASGTTFAVNRYYAKDSAGNQHYYAATDVIADDNTNGSEDASYNIWASVAGTLTKLIQVAATIVFNTTLSSSTRQIAIARGIFDGTAASPTFVSGAHNFSSITKVSTGIYTITMTNAAPDANYVMMGTGRMIGGNNEAIISLSNAASFTPTTTQFRIECRNASGTLFDSDRISLLIN